MRSRLQLGLLLFVMAAGCGRSALSAQDHATHSGGQTSLSAGAVATGSAGDVASGGTSTGGAVADAGIDPDPEPWTAGTEQDDIGSGIAVDRQGNVTIVGITQGALAAAALGAGDAFVRRFNAQGHVVWTHQFGSEREDGALAVALDGDGGAIVVGYTGGSLQGASRGAADAFVRKYHRDGEDVWTRQFGTTAWDGAHAVTVDANGIATVAGATQDAEAWDRPILRSYAANGVLVRSYDLDHLSGTTAQGVAVDSDGNIYLAGATSTELEGPQAGGIDAFLMKINVDGHVVWTRQYGTTSADEGSAVALDHDGNPWLAGYQDAQSSGGTRRSGEGFVRRYDARGTLTFSYAIENGWWDGVDGITVDQRGHGFAVRTRTVSDLTLGWISQVSLDELDSEGTLLGSVRIGEGTASGVAANVSGRVYVLVNAPSFGERRGAGQSDAFVVQVR